MPKGEEYAKALSGATKKHGFDVQYLDTSAKDGINIDQAFHQIGTQVLERMLNKKKK